jgi:hypothetical protein
MEKNELESPILRRSRERSPTYYCLVKVRNITDDDVEHYPKWEIIKKWYEKLENDDPDWLMMALQTMTNAVINQERIYFAVTRDTLTELFQSDKNWKNKSNFGMKASNYELLLQEMVDSKVFEAYHENPKLKAQKKPRIFRVVDKNILSLMKVIPEEVQLKEVVDFVNKNNEIKDEETTGNNVGNNQGNNQGNNVGNTAISNKQEAISKLVTCLPVSSLDENQSVDFEDLLVTQITDLPRFQDIPELADLTVGSCHGFTLDKSTLRKFENHLLGFFKRDLTPKQKKFVENLVKSFEKETKKLLASAGLDKTKLKRATRTNAKFTPTSEEEDAENENNTLKVLNNFFGKENIKILKSRLSQVNNEQEKFEIQKEIEFWESVV